MTQKTNGSGKHDEKVVRLPTLAERDRMRKAKENQEKEWQQQHKAARRAAVPFFNFSKIPPFTGGLILVFIAIHIYFQALISEPALYEIFNNFGFRPSAFSGGRPLTWEAVASPVTHQFLHGSWAHLFFNCMSMLVMGMFFEKTFGPRATAFFFFACGLAGAGAYFALNPFSDTPIIGASGAISGLFGAVTILLFQKRPGARLSKRGPLGLIVFWILFMAGMGMLGGDAMAWQAHVGGFLAGIGLLHLLQTGKIRFRN